MELPSPAAPGKYQIVVMLQYRKIDQYLLNFLLGEGKLTSPVTEIARATATVEVKAKEQAALPKESDAALAGAQAR